MIVSISDIIFGSISLSLPWSLKRPDLLSTSSHKTLLLPEQLLGGQLFGYPCTYFYLKFCESCLPLESMVAQLEEEVEMELSVSKSGMDAMYWTVFET